MQITQLKRLTLEATDTNGIAIPAYQIAGDIGIHPSTFSKYCLGQRELPWQHRDLIADYFEVDGEILDQLVEIDG
jgi:hypothetical protein